MLLFVKYLVLFGAIVLAPVSVPSCLADDEANQGVLSLLSNPTRPSSRVIAGGNLAKEAVFDMADRGVKTIIDLRTTIEGTEDENVAAMVADIRYINIPVGREPPTDTQVAAFANALAEATTGTIVIHCATGVRTGAMWSLYRAQSGVPPEAALAEGLKIGLNGELEVAVRRRLGLPADPAQ